MEALEDFVTECTDHPHLGKQVERIVCTKKNHLNKEEAILAKSLYFYLYLCSSLYDCK